MKKIFIKALCCAAVIFGACNSLSAQIIPEPFPFDVPGVPDRWEGKDSHKHNYERFSDEGITDIEIGTTIGMNEQSPMSVRTSFGSDLRFSLFQASYRPFMNGFRIATDLGVGKSSTRLSGNYAYNLTSDRLIVYDPTAAVNVKKAIVRNWVFSSSILAGIDLGGKVELFGGIQGEFNADGTAVNKYKSSVSGKDKDKFKGVKMNQFTYSYKAGVVFDDFGFYFKYSPCKALKDGMGPDWERCAIGIVLR